MVDTADSKSAEGNLMPVRVRPLVPIVSTALYSADQKPLNFEGFFLLFVYGCSW